MMKKPKIVIIMGATGSGKSKLAIDLSLNFPIEIINADSMQVYKSLDILTNKVPLQDQNGVPHHLLGIIPPNTEFTANDFRNSAIQIIDEIISRNRLPVIVGGTNYYIQTLVSPYLLGDLVEEMDDLCIKGDTGDKGLECENEVGDEECGGDYQRLKELDPESADRIHPNDFRKINQYLGVYARTSVLPSRIFKGKASEKWGRSYDFRYDCCFVCVDASLPVLDQYVEDRVDCMIEAGLLYEVYDIYNLNADYTRGLRQAIGVREFEEFLSVYVDKTDNLRAESSISVSGEDDTKLKVNLKMVLESDGGQLKILLTEAINRLKANTKRLVRRQKRRLSRLQAIFGWELHYVDATDSLLGNSPDSWSNQVVRPSVEIITSFLDAKTLCLSLDLVPNALDERDLWTRHVCEPCGNRLLRGAHEWEQHKQGRAHRKRIAGLKKSQQIMARIATVGSNEADCPTLCDNKDVVAVGVKA